MAAPIALFVYNRPEHTFQTLKALQSNFGVNESDLFIFCDGPKADASKEDRKRIEETREVVRKASGFKSLNLIETVENKGLTLSIVGGINELFETYDELIIVEDDVVTSPYFLNYMNTSLRLYKNESNVMHISGYWFPVKNTQSLPGNFFVNLGTIWGWATWKDAWAKYDLDSGRVLSKFNEQSLHDFDLNGKSDFRSQLERIHAGEMDSWDVFWYAAIYLNNGLSLHPNVSYVQNIGHDNSGVHCYPTDIYSWKKLSEQNEWKKIPLEFNHRAIKLLKQYYSRAYNPSLATRFKNRLKRVFHA